MIAAAILLTHGQPSEALLLWNWSYSGTGVSASGTSTTSDASDEAGFYQIIGIRFPPPPRPENKHGVIMYSGAGGLPYGRPRTTGRQSGRGVRAKRGWQNCLHAIAPPDRTQPKKGGTEKDNRGGLGDAAVACIIECDLLAHVPVRLIGQRNLDHHAV
jgi:hypothetical protein